MDCDILIVGAGTAGLACAIAGASRGLKCVVMHKTPVLTEKPCGEGLTPDCVYLLRQLGVELERGMPFEGIQYYTPHKVQVEFQSLPGIGIRKTALIDAMHKRAFSLGVTFREEKVTKLVQNEEWVEANGIRASWLMGCDGIRSAIRKNGFESKDLQLPPRFGMRQHFHIESPPKHVQVYWADDYELYVTPTGPNEINIAALYSEPRPFAEFLAPFYWTESLGNPTSLAMGTGPFAHRVVTPQSGRCFLVGDSSAFLDPITGEGNRLAIENAIGLVECILAGKPQKYHKVWNSNLRKYWAITSLILAASRPGKRRGAFLKYAPRLEKLMKFCVKHLAENYA